ncbi:group 1 glycosyl transferase, partial [Citrobacter sp. AAK_AS5]
MIRRFLRRNHIAILCTHDYRAGILGRVAALGTGTRWIAFSRGRTSETAAVRAF